MDTKSNNGFQANLSKISEVIDVIDDEELGQIVIPDSVYEQLPPLLKTLCSYFEPGYDRDVFLTSAMVVISSVLSNVKFVHGDGWYHVNLMALVTASAGERKGIGKLGATIGQRN